MSDSSAVPSARQPGPAPHAELERVYDGEVVEDAGWYEEAVSAYVQADEKVTEGKWERAVVAYGMVGRAHASGDGELVGRFAGEVRRSASHLYHEAFACHLRSELEGLGQPIPLTLTPTFYVEAAKGRRKAIEAGDDEAVREAGELLAKAEDEHWTTSTLRRNAGGTKETKLLECAKCGEVYPLSEARTWTEEA